LDPVHPLLTITKALSLCVNDRNDYIILLDYYQPSGETWPISVNKSLVNIIGLPCILGGPFGRYTPWVVGVASGTNKPFMDIVANNVFIQGIGMYASDTGAACITMDDGASTVHIDSCRFNQGTYGVHLTDGDTGYGIHISNCWFQAGLASGGIYINDDPAHNFIRDNYFDQLAGPAISVAGGAATVIEGNRIVLASGYSAGAGITLGGSAAARHFVHDNYAYRAKVTGASGNNPFVDTSTAGNWGLNYYGITVTQPA
jgi:pectate lyase